MEEEKKKEGLVRRGICQSVVSKLERGTFSECCNKLQRMFEVLAACPYGS